MVCVQNEGADFLAYIYMYSYQNSRTPYMSYVGGGGGGGGEMSDSGVLSCFKQAPLVLWLFKILFSLGEWAVKVFFVVSETILT